ncbi:MAG: aminotransferase class III-fold pyridoxal phosphate-dependent enzyme, partial [Rhodospirillaceae bacterium]|nr:aminotransferase class III-fold pyridoxal phosphate-dependent enzyme [Rhodospirillaceae bacterium]
GNMWGCDTYNIQPDLLTCAKQLSSAYIPIGAVLCSDKLYKAFVEQSKKLGIFGTGNTYGGHPVAAAVALETLKIYEDEDILGHVRAIMPHFQKRLAKLADHALVGDARGVGLIGAIEIVKDKATKEQYPVETKAAPLVAEKIMAENLILRPTPGDGVGICPPLIITDAEIDDMFDRIERGLDAAAAVLKK